MLNAVDPATCWMTCFNMQHHVIHWSTLILLWWWTVYHWLHTSNKAKNFPFWTGSKCDLCYNFCLEFLLSVLPTLILIHGFHCYSFVFTVYYCSNSLKYFTTLLHTKRLKKANSHSSQLYRVFLGHGAEAAITAHHCGKQLTLAYRCVDGSTWRPLELHLNPHDRILQHPS